MGDVALTLPITTPMSPMSWKSGSQLTPTSWTDTSMPAGPVMASTLAPRLSCDSTTPFGCDVDPDVNWTRAS